MFSFKLNDGTEIPAIGFGTGTAHWKKDATDILSIAIDNGFTYIDTAQLYGNEESVCSGIKKSGRKREDLYLLTKLKVDLEPGESVRDSLTASLAKMGTTYVDLFLVHSPRTAKYNNMTMKQLWGEMEALKREGLTRSIGVSNFFTEDIREVLDGCNVVPAVNQIELHPYVWKECEETIKICREHNIILQSYGAMMPLTRATGGPLDAVLPKISEHLSATLGAPVTSTQVLTKWMWQKGVIVVTTSTKEERIKEYIGTETVPDLAEDEINTIDEAGSKMSLERRIFASYRKRDAEEAAKEAEGGNKPE